MSQINLTAGLLELLFEIQLFVYRLYKNTVANVHITVVFWLVLGTH